MKIKITLLAICLIFISCSRSDDENSNNENQKYYIKFKINDIDREEYAQKSTSGYTFETSNFEDHSLSFNYRIYATDVMNIDIFDYPLNVKTYNWSNANTNNMISLTKFRYSDAQTNIQYYYLYSPNVPLYNENSNFSLTINQLENGEVRGSFSGKIVAYDTTTSPYTKKVFNIKNGEFYMPINKYP